MCNRDWNQMKSVCNHYCGRRLSIPLFILALVGVSLSNTCLRFIHLIDNSKDRLTWNSGARQCRGLVCQREDTSLDEEFSKSVA
ncbi:hypothetical protein MPTK1_3g12770 [Marchantia polymorpha subsp. ruderalis]|uniref:Uncharacterized protein n=2 Tax=Marchantia polymorpha TaxID=3197 RepID=A0AAF6B065_MARPO|nr:hypothetical protein MARPO_0050s0069 [Marchantia polymorpha]BBN05399.1 hypothetical protein Mp_3g12770 [Marchantia polymorpha subsp. ruderalis]|eukprot:PTQ38612.1 hypothetical protein MARPO_0050s0069 [Marchantia polymorpha]